MDELDLGNVRPFDRPMTAGRNDRYIATDELGNKIYETVAGKRYTIRPATEDESKTTRAKVEDWVDEGAPLPSWEQITDTMKALPGAVYDSAQRVLSGDASLGEVVGFAGASGAPGVALRVGTAMDPSVVSAMGATHKVPRYPKKKPVAPKIEEPEAFDDDGFLLLETPKPDINFGVTALREIFPEDHEFNLTTGTWAYAPNIPMHDMARLRLGQINLPDLLSYYGMDADPELLDYVSTRMVKLSEKPEFQDYVTRLQQHPNFDIWGQDPFDVDGDFSVTGDGFTDRPTIQFRDPLDEILSEMEIPAKGITGAQLLKELQDNPTVRMAQLRSQGVLDRIDPAKRYNDPKVRSNRNEVEDLLLEGKYTVQAVPQNRYDSYQRQPVADKELKYIEYAINADTDGPTFKANSQHYQDNTLAHVRLSERENPAGNYVLIEELQSDLLQKGYAKPISDHYQAMLDNVVNQWRRDYPEWEGDARAFKNLTPEDLVKAKTILSEEDWSAKLSSFAEELSFEPRFDGLDKQDLDDILYRLDLENPFATKQQAASLPPIVKMEESVRLGLETAIAHAAQNNIERVVLPPFHRIVEQRFTKGSAEYNKAMDPKSGFYQTYVGAMTKVLKKLNEDMGMDVEVKEFNLSYQDAFDNTPIVDFLDSQTSHSMSILSNAMFKLRTSGGSANWTSDEKLAYLDFRDKVREVIPNFQMADFKAIFDIMGDESSLYTLARKLTPLETPPYDPGLEINFSNAIKSGYDLTKPRFAEGGLVSSDDENRWMHEFNL